jgi:DNA polymerase-3 subunit delta'
MILGHETQIEYLKKIVKENRISHALLFCGPEKIGKKQVAFEFCSLILGKDFKKNPDFLLIEGENSIQIDQIRELIFKFNLKPIKSNWQIAILDNAHLMTKDAQQSFLKILEEPKTTSIFVLITAYPYLLLPTILSRCQRINFYPVSREKISNFLERNTRFTEKEKKIILDVSAGRPGVLFDLISKPEKIEMFEKLKNISKIPLYKRFEVAKKILEKKNEKEFLKDWLNYFRYLFLDKLKNKEFEEQPSSLLKLKSTLEMLQNSLFLLSTTNINKRLIFEILMLNL